MATTKKPARKGGAKKCAPKKAASIKKKLPPIVRVSEPARERLGVKPSHPTVEEQFEADAALMQVLHDPENQPSQYGTVPMSYLDKPRPGLLRRAIDRVKRAFNFRSSKSGRYVKPEYAEANPDTTVRERVT